MYHYFLSLIKDWNRKIFVFPEIYTYLQHTKADRLIDWKYDYLYERHDDQL